MLTTFVHKRQHFCGRKCAIPPFVKVVYSHFEPSEVWPSSSSRWEDSIEHSIHTFWFRHHTENPNGTINSATVEWRARADSAHFALSLGRVVIDRFRRASFPCFRAITAVSIVVVTTSSAFHSTDRSLFMLVAGWNHHSFLKRRKSWFWHAPYSRLLNSRVLWCFFSKSSY